MELPNREGTPVDPVPFLVVVGIALAFCYSFGPGYFMALGLSLPWALAISTVAFLAATGGAYYRLVWTARPAYREEVPVEYRFRRLYLAILIGIAVLLLLLLPVLAR